MASDTAPLSQKVQAQYQLGFLKLQKAQGLFKEDVGQYDEEYKNATRDAAQTYAQIYEIANQAGIDKVPESALIYVRHGIYQAGEVWYSLQFQADLQKAVPMLEKFVELVDGGVFGDPNDPEFQELVKKAMNYVASSYFQLARYADLDPQVFEDSNQAFKKLVSRFPNDPKAAEWQYTAAEAHFASGRYQEAIDEYEKVVEINPQHENAPDALYAISTCYSAIAEETDDPDKKKEIVQKVYDLNERLAKEYPNSTYAPEALINLGNKYYNEGSNPDISVQEKERLYGLAIENYEKAINIESIDPTSKNQALEYLLETKNALAIDIFYKGLAQIEAAEELEGEEKRAKIDESVGTFKGLTEGFSDTPSGELAYVQLGKAYTMLASEYDESYYKEALQAYGYLWNKYANATPDSNQVANAVEHSKRQIQQISAYIESKKIHEGSE
jgi:tetratricopeptide (TPR) repeat protein